MASNLLLSCCAAFASALIMRTAACRKHKPLVFHVKALQHIWPDESLVLEYLLLSRQKFLLFELGRPPDRFHGASWVQPHQASLWRLVRGPDSPPLLLKSPAWLGFNCPNASLINQLLIVFVFVIFDSCQPSLDFRLILESFWSRRNPVLLIELMKYLVSLLATLLLDDCTPTPEIQHFFFTSEHNKICD